MEIRGNYAEHVHGEANRDQEFEFTQIVTRSYGRNGFRAIERAVVTQERRRARRERVSAYVRTVVTGRKS